MNDKSERIWKERYFIWFGMARLNQATFGGSKPYSAILLN
jgi:hypothetical protein